MTGLQEADNTCVNEPRRAGILWLHDIPARIGLILLRRSFTAPVSAQLQQGTIVGTVVGPDDAAIDQARGRRCSISSATPVTTVDGSGRCVSNRRRSASAATR